MDDRVTLGVCRHGQTLPLHPGVEHPQDEVKDPIIAQFALWTALGHREVRQDKCLELRCGELDRNRCLAGFDAAVFIMQGPYGRNSEANWGSELLRILQRVRNNCKIRNQLCEGCA